MPLASGRLSVTFTGTYFEKFDIQNGAFQHTVGTVVGTTGFGGVTPRWRHYAMVDFTRGAWSVSLAQTYQLGYKDLPGTFEDVTDPAFQARRVGSYEIYDLHGSYTATKHFKVAAGVRNLLDRAPPYTNAGGQNYFQGGYDPTYVDPRGRTYYVSLGYTFR
jgi:iron complex outermembrane receptor protein